MVQRIENSNMVKVYTTSRDYKSTDFQSKEKSVPQSTSTDPFKKPFPVPDAPSSRIAVPLKDAFKEHSIKPCQVALINIAPELASMAKLVRGKTRYSIKKTAKRATRQPVKVEPTEPTSVKRPRKQSIGNSAAKKIKIEPLDYLNYSAPYYLRSRS